VAVKLDKNLYLDEAGRMVLFRLNTQIPGGPNLRGAAGDSLRRFFLVHRRQNDGLIGFRPSSEEREARPIISGNRYYGRLRIYITSEL